MISDEFLKKRSGFNREELGKTLRNRCAMLLRYDKVRDLARFLVAEHPQLLGRPRTAKWSEEEISCLLRELIIKQLGVTDFDDNSRFVDDLRVD